ncbi:MAG: hypothetical protein IJD22_00530 [Clostridia bacterium]|nr:hypothetical protein [Clostridia bacterium]
MKKAMIAPIILLSIVQLLLITVRGGTVYEYDMSADARDEAEARVEALIESLPEEIRDELPEKNRTSYEEYSADFFWQKIRESLKKAVAPATKTLSGLLGNVLIAAVFHMLSKTISNGELNGAFSVCSTLSISVGIFAVMEGVFATAKGLLHVLCESMLAIVPVMEALHITSGRLSSAAVTQTGVAMMIGLAEALFSRVISVWVYVAFILAVVSCVTGNKGISFMSSTLRGLITGTLIAVMTVLTFAFSLQAIGADGADTLAVKTVKFALGSYLPIVGGPVAESFSMLFAGLSVIKQACGIVGIAVVAVAFLAPFISILINTVVIGLSGTVARVLGCEREGELLSECRSICIQLLAITAGAAVMFIIALGIFCKSSTAV